MKGGSGEEKEITRGGDDYSHITPSKIIQPSSASFPEVIAQFYVSLTAQSLQGTRTARSEHKYYRKEGACH
ncbi:hypothetical protein Q5P01_001159 [Channa striata]|uniref:Uncharacterized protein n=1 Tax=Channa striata TaxID=64152 RepID=A0AA88NQF2_CHASR|nr:hypothetical protein Q5P01_001159 [Channa striata]